MTTLRYSDTASFSHLNINGPRSIAEDSALRALGRDVLKTPLHWLAMNLALDAYQSMVTDRRIVTVRGTGERISIADLIVSTKPEHVTPRTDLIMATAERLGLPGDLLTLVVTRVLSVKDAQVEGSRERYNAVMKARALDDVQFVYVYDDDGGHGAVETYSRKQRIAATNAAHAARAAAPRAVPTVRPASSGIGGRLLSMFNR
ncbi:hypothetical protein MJ547_04575, partial [Burkholderia gladioli]